MLINYRTAAARPRAAASALAVATMASCHRARTGPGAARVSAPLGQWRVDDQRRWGLVLMASCNYWGTNERAHATDSVESRPQCDPPSLSRHKSSVPGPPPIVRYVRGTDLPLVDAVLASAFRLLHGHQHVRLRVPAHRHRRRDAPTARGSPRRRRTFSRLRRSHGRRLQTRRRPPLQRRMPARTPTPRKPRPPSAAPSSDRDEPNPANPRRLTHEAMR